MGAKLRTRCGVVLEAFALSSEDVVNSLELLRHRGARIVTGRVGFAEEVGKIFESLMVDLVVGVASESVGPEPGAARGLVHLGHELLAHELHPVLAVDTIGRQPWLQLP
ncbi:hypothetical protein PPSIR1_10570 [Plesiocystis pacifica SIR-1]|uniref:Uncharacterized protein n=1 Tax=Plesiocystis pacifica SIR-1 TaxID=391625 RepID=A6G4U8_9BACT|nr:hypothetical protein [Plesiocystis pacifica]EDM79040.1 hypothetical protein PPSIR1_10570 [Plesiocystis pacifica SIR-1]